LSQYSFNYTVRFIAFSGEEVGRYGSYWYARDVSRRGDNIVAVINLDEIGYSNTMEGGRTFPFLCPSRSKWIGDFALTVSTLYINQTNMTIELIPNAPGSDHQSFVEYGFDAIFGSQYDYDEYYEKYIRHSQNDTSDRINWTYLTKVTKLLVGVIGELASTPLELQVIITKPYQGYLYFFNHPLHPLDFWKNSWLGLRGTTFIYGRAKVNVNVIPYNDVVSVLFCIDGNFIDPLWDPTPQPHYEWIIHNWYNQPLFGRYTVEVYVGATSGKVASDEINIMIYQL
jgi:hypothetical protein